MTILVVEDEVLIRLMLSDNLRDFGYQVIEAGDADAAILLLSDMMPQLIITDVRMPGSMDGIGLLSLVRNRYPTLPVIVASAHMTHLPLTDGHTHFLSKPYSYERLTEVIETALLTSGVQFAQRDREIGN